MAESGLDPHKMLEGGDLTQIHDEGQLMNIVDRVIGSTPESCQRL